MSVVRTFGVSQLLAAGFLLVACKGGDTEDTGVEEPVNEGPVISHTPPTGPLETGSEVAIDVTATDSHGVSSVTMYWRISGRPTWETMQLTGDGDQWTGAVADVEAPGLEYYLKAVDGAPNSATTYAPVESDDDPFVVDVLVDSRPLPWHEDFETADETSYVYSFDFAEYSDGFPGYTWDLSQARASSGVWAVAHRRGIADIDPLVDWLVSPPLDFTTADRIQVTWNEYGESAELGAHSLWISTGSPDPDDGGFERVIDLENPQEDAWSRTAVVDLTAWSGSSVVYLAWLYEGQFSDAWYMDDIDVRELGPDIELVDFDWAPNPVGPGESASVSMTLRNRTDVATTDLSVAISGDEASATWGTPAAVGVLDGGAETTVDITVDVSADHPDNAYLPFTIEATDGTAAWAWDRKMVVGEQSMATIAFQPYTEGLMVMQLGVGPRDAPDFSIGALSAVVPNTSQTVEVDLTDAFAHLPPEPGAGRWWLEVDSTPQGDLTQFEIEFDGVTYTSDDIGFFNAESIQTFYLPRPPDPVYVGHANSPSPVQPGDTVALSVTLDNAGADTIGLTTGTLWTDNPNVTITSAGPETLDATAWTGGSPLSLGFEFTVSAEKIDSRPIDFSITVSDDIESFEVPFEVAVPWPVLHVTGVLVDDWADGDNDGLLDEGETTNLEIYLTNVGDQSTFGGVTCTLTQTAGTGTATLLTDSGDFGILASGETADENDFQIEATAGSDGDNIELMLTCVDGTNTYTSVFELIIGEAPWLSLSALPDPSSDALDAYQFDLVDGQYRSDGTTLEIVLTSSVEYDGSTLFMEAWGNSTGGDYTWYQLVLQSGVGTMRGYDSGVFTKLSNPVVTEVDAYTIHVAVDVPSMGLALDSLSLGFAAGFCGDPTYYCDHFPDAWGDPYNTGMRTGLWFDLGW
jgi:hypothetical protein